MKQTFAVLIVSLLSVAFASESFAQQGAKQGSRLETYNIETGEITLVKEFDYLINAPEYTRDGKWIYYNSGGLIYKIAAEGGEPIKIDTGDIRGCNNDHVISPDGKTLAVSSDGSRGVGGSRIFVLPVDGVTEGKNPQLVTEKAPSYLHGWSPDGKLLLFTGKRNNAVNYLDLFSVTLDGKTEVNLTDSPGLDDGSEYTPDGKYIWFNSERSGLMQLWRMKPDGSEPTHMVKEEANGWFPHPSPDGKWISYIVYAKGDVAPGDHPSNKNVAIRLVSSEGGESRELLKLFGGQGSFNVNSWSPDSKRFAYVRYNQL
jgi:Tol biopolymer transport system component